MDLFYVGVGDQARIDVGLKLVVRMAECFSARERQAHGSRREALRAGAGRGCSS